MNFLTAYEQRESLSNNQLERLLAALRDEVVRYLDVIENYPADRLEKHGKPHLIKLELRVAIVEQLIKSRTPS